MRLLAVLSLLLATAAAGDEEFELRRAELRARHAENLLKAAEEIARERKKLHEASAISAESMQEVLLQRDEARAEHDKRQIDLEEVKATGRAPNDELGAPRVGERDFVALRLAADAKIARLRGGYLAAREKRQLRLLKAGAGSQLDYFEAQTEARCAAAEASALEEIVAIRARIARGEIEGDRGERLANVVRAKADVECSAARLGLARAVRAELKAAFDAGRTTKSVLRSVESELFERETEWQLARLDLEQANAALGGK